MPNCTVRLGDTNPASFPSLLHLLEDAMLRHADRTAFRVEQASLTYADVDRKSAALASYLQHQLGICKGDRVAVMVPNLPAFPVSLLGIMRAGAAQVNVNPLYTARELKHQLTDAGCQTIVIYAGSTTTLADILPETPIKNVVVVNNDCCIDLGIAGRPVDSRLGDAVTLTDALNAGMQLSPRRIELTGADLLFLQYTGGTTGLSKGAALSHQNLLSVTRQIRQVLLTHLESNEQVIVTAIPLYHIFALAVNLILYFEIGATNWLVPNPRDMDNFVSTLKEARPTAFSGVNTLFNGLLSHPRISEVDWSRLQITMGGGAPVMKGTAERWQALTGRTVHEGYGLSETSVGVSLVPAGVSYFTGTCGRPLSQTAVKLVDNDGEVVPPGASGEIVVKGPQVMLGYWNQPESTAAAFTPDGFFRTGDIGVFDENGFLKIVDRKKDMVLVSGFNVYPNEIEEWASRFPGLLECAAVGMPDKVTGEAIKLYAVRAPGAIVTEDELLAHCRRGLTAYKVPRAIVFIDALPKSAVGKVLRRELRGFGA